MRSLVAPSNLRGGTNKSDKEGKVAAQNLGFPLCDSTGDDLISVARAVNELGPGHHDFSGREGHERNE